MAKNTHELGPLSVMLSTNNVTGKQVDLFDRYIQIDVSLTAAALLTVVPMLVSEFQIVQVVESKYMLTLSDTIF